MDLPILTFGNIAKRDLLGTPYPVQEPQRHTDAAIGWLTRAHDKGTDGGVSYGYSLRGGWRPPYRETSGYIAETFYDLAHQLGSADHGERATRICRWLCRVQNPDGSISNPAYDASKGIVFDTGQVLHGLVRGFEETGDAEILRAAEKAADWLTTVADGEKRWTREPRLGALAGAQRLLRAKRLRGRHRAVHPHDRLRDSGPPGIGLADGGRPLRQGGRG